MMIFLTGVGARLLGRVLAVREPETRFQEALRKLTVVARGPKPIAVLREWQVDVTVAVPEPNTWRELLAAIAARPEKSVAVQEYGRSNTELLDGLAAQGRSVFRVPVYQWRLPSDTAPLAEALKDLLAGRVSRRDLHYRRTNRAFPRVRRKPWPTGRRRKRLAADFHRIHRPYLQRIAATRAASPHPRAEPSQDWHPCARSRTPIR